MVVKFFQHNSKLQDWLLLIRKLRVGYEQNRQLAITESGPIAMRNKDTVNDLLNTHFRKNRNDERYRIDPLYFLSHHKPPGYELYDDHDMTSLNCSEQFSQLIQMG